MYEVDLGRFKNNSSEIYLSNIANCSNRSLKNYFGKKMFKRWISEELIEVMYKRWILYELFIYIFFSIDSSEAAPINLMPVKRFH